MGGHDHRAVDSRGPVTAGAPAPAQTWQGSSVFTQLVVLTRRSLLGYLTDGRALVLSMAQPIIILFLITSVFSKFGTLIPGYPAGVSYFVYVLPAVLVDNAVQTSLLTGAGLIDELRNGVAPRLRSLPIRPGSILIARSLTGLFRTALQACIILGLAELTHGNIARGGLAALATAVGLTMLVGWGVGWVFLAAGVWIRHTETLTNLGYLILLPLTFVSSAYVPLTALPTPMRDFARANPVTYVINAERAVFLHSAGGPADTRLILLPIVFSLGLGILAGFGTMRLFRRPVVGAWQ
jgi:ABC-2 type transport system permease protein